MVEEEKTVQETATKEFPHLKDAKFWLNQKHGIPYNKIINQTSVEREFEKLKIKLVISKK